MEKPETVKNQKRCRNGNGVEMKTVSQPKARDERHNMPQRRKAPDKLRLFALVANMPSMPSMPCNTFRLTRWP